MLRFGEELLEILLPNGGEGVRAVATGLVGFGEEDRLAVFYALDLGFEKVLIRGIDQVIGGIDGD